MGVNQETEALTKEAGLLEDQGDLPLIQEDQEKSLWTEREESLEAQPLDMTVIEDTDRGVGREKALTLIQADHRETTGKREEEAGALQILFVALNCRRRSPVFDAMKDTLFQPLSGLIILVSCTLRTTSTTKKPVRGGLDVESVKRIINLWKTWEFMNQQIIIGWKMLPFNVQFASGSSLLTRK